MLPVSFSCLKCVESVIERPGDEPKVKRSPEIAVSTPKNRIKIRSFTQKNGGGFLLCCCWLFFLFLAKHKAESVNRAGKLLIEFDGLVLG
jgi:hypothetical protein